MYLFPELPRETRTKHRCGPQVPWVPPSDTILFSLPRRQDREECGVCVHTCPRVSVVLTPWAAGAARTSSKPWTGMRRRQGAGLAWRRAQHVLREHDADKGPAGA